MHLTGKTHCTQLSQVRMSRAQERLVTSWQKQLKNQLRFGYVCSLFRCGFDIPGQGMLVVETVSVIQTTSLSALQCGDWQTYPRHRSSRPSPPAPHV